MFITPSNKRNAAETEEPMMPPMWEKLSKRLETAAAVAATMIDVTITMLNLTSGLSFNLTEFVIYVEWPSEKNVPTVTGFCPEARSLLVIRSIACHVSILGISL